MMKMLEQLLGLLCGVTGGVAGTLYWLALIEGMDQLRQPATLAGFLFIMLGLASGWMQRRNTKAAREAAS